MVVLLVVSLVIIGSALTLLVEVRGERAGELTAEHVAEAEAIYARARPARPAQPAPSRAIEPVRPPAADTPTPARRSPIAKRKSTVRSKPTTPSSRDDRRFAGKSSEYVEGRKKLHELYTGYDYAGSLELAQGLLEEDPDDKTLREVIVVSACAENRIDLAREHYALTRGAVRRRVARKCRDVGVDNLGSARATRRER